MAVLLGLVAALCFGTADFFVPKASQKEGGLKALLWSQIMGGATMLALLLLMGFSSWRSAFSIAGLAALGIGLELVVAFVCLFRALQLGPLLIVSPISSSFAAITTVLSLLSGESLNILQGVGLLVTLIGVILATASTTNLDTPDSKLSGRASLTSWLHSGLLYAAASAVLFGVGFWLLRFASPELGSLYTVLLMRIAGISFLALVFLIKKSGPRLHSTSSLMWLLPIGVLNAGGTAFYNWGIAVGLTAVVSVITSLYSVVTIVLGYLFLRYRITRLQGIGVALTLLGVALVSL